MCCSTTAPLPAPVLSKTCRARRLREIFEVNLFGYHDLARRVIPMMRAQGQGRIINCSSVLGLVGMRWRGAYVATKFAMEGLTDVLRVEMAGTGIKVILIEPGPIGTKIRENSIPHFEKWIDWENSARRRRIPQLAGHGFTHPAGRTGLSCPARR